MQEHLSVGAKLIEAKASLQYGEWGRLVKLLPFGNNTAQRLMSISDDPRLANTAHGPLLPTSWRSLYELTKLDDDQWALAKEGGLIRPDLERAIEEKIDEQAEFSGWWRENVSTNKGGDRRSDNL